VGISLIAVEFKQVAAAWHSCMAYVNMPAAGCGAEAAIGQLTRLTSLHLSVDRREESPGTTLQLQLLGWGGAAGHSSSVHGGTSARSSMGLQELSLQCIGQLSDDELAAAAAALPDLRRLEVDGYSREEYVPLRGLVGSGLAAFSACRRLRDISLRRCEVLEGQQLITQLPRVSSLASVLIFDGTRVSSAHVKELRAAFKHEHDRSLRVEQRYSHAYGFA
jgi:hypothetical protein